MEYIIEATPPEEYRAIYKPRFSYPSGTYSRPIEVTIDYYDWTGYAISVMFTSDNTVPVPALLIGTPYTHASLPIQVAVPLTLIAVAKREGWKQSEAIEVNYQF